MAQSQSQTAQNTVTAAQAQASVGTAEAQAAAIGIQSAEVKTAQYNLAHTTITSPVNGTVIARNVSLGETVASSFSTPVVVHDRAGSHENGGRPGGRRTRHRLGESRRTGDLYRARVSDTTFTGTVSQVRQNPTVVSNVVTYDTVVIVNNKNGLLRPGMTANALIQTQVASNALIVPLQALEWRPSAAVAARYHLPAPAGNARRIARRGGTVRAPRVRSSARRWARARRALPAGSNGRIFVERAGALLAVPVQIVLTAATQAAVKPVSGTLAVTDAVVTGDNSGARPRAAAPAPAAPGFGQSASGGGAARAVRLSVPVVRTVDLHKDYAMGDQIVHAVAGVSVTIETRRVRRR